MTGAVVLIRQLLNAFHLTQNSARYFKDFLSGWGDSGEVFTTAREYLYTQLVLK